MPVKAPTTNAGSGLAAIKPRPGGVDGTPLTVTGSAVVSTNIIDSDAFYIYSTVPLHFRTSTGGDNATVNDAPVPAHVPMVFHCGRYDKISLIKMTGAPDGTAWIHPCEMAE